jgi:hypothetical protein
VHLFFKRNTSCFFLQNISNSACLGGWGGYLYYFSDNVAIILKSIVVESKWCELVLCDFVSYGIYILSYQLLMSYYSAEPHSSKMIALCIDFLIL